MTNAPPKPPTEKQKLAFDVLIGEREYQTKTHGDTPVPTIVDFANLLIEYTDKLAVDVVVDPSGASPAGGPLKRLREIAAIALHAMEAHGIQPRENHVPASAGITGTLHIVMPPDTTTPAKPAPVHAAAPPEHVEQIVPPLHTTEPAPMPTAAVPGTVHHSEAVPVEHHTTTEEHGKK